MPNMGTKRSYVKDVHKLMKNIGSLSAGQARILGDPFSEEAEEENTIYERFAVEIEPSDGLYHGGKFKFLISTDTLTWPNLPPVVWCETNIYHPNIDTLFGTDKNDNNICVSLLEDWEPYNSFDDVIQAILFLFYEPNCEDSLTPYVDDDVDFEENVRQSLKGGKIEGLEFKPNYGWLENNPIGPTTSRNESDTDDSEEDKQNVEELSKCNEDNIENQNELLKKNGKYYLFMIQAYSTYRSMQAMVSYDLVYRICQFVVCNFMVFQK